MILRLLRQALLLSYIFLTFCALCYTLARKQIPHVEWPFVKHFYAMMAPFQGYITNNVELTAEGLAPDNTWKKIDYTIYMPHSRGEIAIRTRMSSFGDKKTKYTEMAKRILELEAERGRVWHTVRLTWEKWPKSQYGFHVNHIPEKTTRNPVTQYPPR